MTAAGRRKHQHVRRCLSDGVQKLMKRGEGHTLASHVSIRHSALTLVFHGLFVAEQYLRPFFIRDHGCGGSNAGVALIDKWPHKNDNIWFVFCATGGNHEITQRAKRQVTGCCIRPSGSPHTAVVGDVVKDGTRLLNKCIYQVGRLIN